MSGEKQDFLRRWSRLKREAAAAPSFPVEKSVEDKPVQLPPIDSLSFDSDFKAFMHSKVEDAVKRAALKKLFSDPRFNVMDGLDTYIDDYTKAEPISEELLARIEQVREQLLAPPVPDDEAEKKPSEGIPEGKSQAADATQDNVDPAQDPKAL
jgi:hypothetical protein